MSAIRPATGLLALAFLALAAVPQVVDGTYYTFLIIIVMIYGVATIGLNVLAGHAGQFSLGHAAFMAVGAYGSALLAKSLAGLPLFAATGLHVWVGVVVGTVGGGLAGLVLAYPALRVKGPYLAMVTIAFGWVVWKILQEWVSVTGGDLGLGGIPRAQFGPLILGTNGFYYVVLVLFAVAFVLQHVLMTSPLGLKIRALKHSEMGLASIGTNVHRLKIFVFVLSAAFAGCAGSLFAIQQAYISPDNFQFFSSVFLLLAVLFGGPATVTGPVVGAAVLVVLPELLHSLDKYRLIGYGVFTLVALYFLPRGVAGPFESLFKPAPPARSSSQPAPFAGDTVAGLSVDLTDVSLSFGGIKALTKVDLALKPGTVHAVIGPNGAGKTTLVNVITGVYRPDAGTILIDGESQQFAGLDAAARAGLARTFQTIKLFGDMTVLDHVVSGLPAGTADPVGEADALIDFVGITALRDLPADGLAYGHRRLVEIARALATRPRLLLLDEPAAGLVKEEIGALVGVIQAIRRSGISILLIEHHMDLVMTVSDRVTVLNYGTVIADGAPAEVQRDPHVVEAYLGPSHVAA